MVICAVIGCHTRSDRGNTIALFRMPRVKKHQGEKDRQLSEDRRRQFLANIYRSNVSEAMIENMRICARHFVSGRPANFRDTTNVDWAPTLLLGHNNINLDNVKASHLRNVRAVDRRRKKLNHEAAQILVSLQTSLMLAEEETGVTENITSGKPANFSDNTNVDWAPTLNLGHNNIGLSQVKACHMKAVSRRIRKSNHEAAETLDSLQSMPMPVKVVTVETVTYESNGLPELVMTCEDEADIVEEKSKTAPLHERKPLQNSAKECVQCKTKDASIALLDLEIQNLHSELYALRKRVASLEFTEDTFRDDDSKVRFYTGLPSFAVFQLAFGSTIHAPYQNHRNSLTPFQECLLTLMKLRLNMPCQDLSYRFNISLSTATRIFNKWVKLLALNLKKFIFGPETESLNPDLQQSSSENKAVIIDSFEIPIECSSEKTINETGMQGKHAKTVKFVIGITTEGSVSYISRVLDGSPSERHETEKTLSPGDPALYDGGTTDSSAGFNCVVLDTTAVTIDEKQLSALGVAETWDIGSIQVHVNNAKFAAADSAGPNPPELAIPTVMKGNKQFSSVNIAETSKVTNSKVYIKRLISQVRQKYSILNDQMPFSFAKAPVIDDIVTVCFALSNLCPSAQAAE